MKTGSFINTLNQPRGKDKSRQIPHNVALVCSQHNNEEIDEYYDALIRNYLAHSLYQSFNEKFEASIEKWDNYLNKSFIHYWKKAVEKR